MAYRRRGGSWPLWLVVVLLVALHFYLRPRMYAGRGAPDFLLIALLIVALRSRPGTAAVAGFLVGLVTDVLSPVRFGAGALAHTVVAWGAAWGRAVVFPDNPIVNGAMFGLGTLLRNLILLLATGGGLAGVAAAFGPWPLLQAVTTAIAGILVALAIRHRVDLRFDA